MKIITGIVIMNNVTLVKKNKKLTKIKSYRRNESEFNEEQNKKYRKKVVHLLE